MKHLILAALLTISSTTHAGFSDMNWTEFAASDPQGHDTLLFNIMTLLTGNEICISITPLPDQNPTTSPVPIPPAVWLFGSAIVGLVGVSRRDSKPTS